MLIKIQIIINGPVWKNTWSIITRLQIF